MRDKILSVVLYMVAVIYAVVAYIDDEKSAFIPIMIVLISTFLVIEVFRSKGRGRDYG